MSRYEKHGMNSSAEYRAWCSMRYRCTQPWHDKYSRFGAIGISVCAEWDQSFAVFLKDMGNKPTPQHFLALYPNPHGDFEPGNVVWKDGKAGERGDGVLWTDEDVERLISLKRSGLSHPRIGEEMGRTTNSIASKLLRLSKDGVCLSLIVDESNPLSKQYPSRSKKEAREKGDRYYFNGRPCPKGHIAPRNSVNGGCRECRDAIMHDYHIRNKSEIAARKSAWYLDNLQRERQRSKDRHPLLRAESQRNWRLKNPDKVLEGKRRFFERNPNYNSVAQSRRRTRISQSASHFTQRDVNEILDLQKGKCGYCRKKLSAKEKHIDHINPLARGGDNSRKNIQILCQKCNLQKSAKDPIDFARSKGLLI